MPASTRTSQGPSATTAAPQLSGLKTLGPPYAFLAGIDAAGLTRRILSQ
jgi:hypothetical protein